MNQKWFNITVTHGDNVLQTGLWAKNLVEAKEEAYWKWRNADSLEVVEQLEDDDDE